MVNACGGVCKGLCVQLLEIAVTDDARVIVYGRDFNIFSGCQYAQGGTPNATYNHDFGGGDDSCSAYSALDVPYLSTTNGACDFTASTCTVDAV